MTRVIMNVDGLAVEILLNHLLRLKLSDEACFLTLLDMCFPRVGFGVLLLFNLGSC